MLSTLRFMLALAVSLLLMLAFRALAFTIYIVDGEGLKPEFETGDHVMVNRWSYGLRTGSQRGLFHYGRILRRPVAKGDIVAYEDPTDPTRKRVLLGRCCALPGDTVDYNGITELVPSVANCAGADYYWIGALGQNNPTDSRQLGFISEHLIIGRAFVILYNHAPSAPIWSGFRGDRILIHR